jgi:cytosine/adenosine deaminase-related metal-dependent hydrolase
MTTENKILKNAWICQLESGRIKPVFGDLHIAAGSIENIVQKNYHTEFIEKDWIEKNSDHDQYDLGGRVVTLPLVNFHDHFYSRLAKGLPLTGPQDNFLQILESLWWKLDRVLDEEIVRASVHLAMLESIRQGVTTIFDHHASPNTAPGILDKIADTVAEYGLRVVLCLETSDRHDKYSAQAALQQNKDFILNHSEGDTRGMLGLHAPFTLTDDSLNMASEMLRELDSAIHIHLAEDKYETDYSLKNFWITPTERLDKFNLLTTQTILGHGIYLQESDYQIIAKRGSAISYNPDSNMNNAVGLPDYKKAFPKIPILPGTDGMHANIAHTLKQLYLLYRHQGNSFPHAFQWIEKIYMDSYQFVKQIFSDFPTLHPGDRADFIVWDYVPPTPFSTENFWGHWLYGIIESPVHTVVQRGNTLLENRQLIDIDENKIQATVNRQGERLYKMFENLIR